MSTVGPTDRENFIQPKRRTPPHVQLAMIHRARAQIAQRYRLSHVIRTASMGMTVHHDHDA